MPKSRTSYDSSSDLSILELREMYHEDTVNQARQLMMERMAADSQTFVRIWPNLNLSECAGE
jgi:hypothetical protein